MAESMANGEIRGFYKPLEYRSLDLSNLKIE